MFGLHMGRMGGSGYRGGSAPVWTPAQNFASGQQGLWYDPSTFASLFQDSAGTSPATATGQPAGRMLDLSGRGNHISQPTASARPLISAAGGAQYLTFDGLDDGLATGAVTLTADMDCFIAVRRNSAETVVMAYPAIGDAKFFGVAQAGNTSFTPDAGSGTPTYWIDGIARANRNEIHLALTVSAWHVMEVRNLNLSTWTALGFGNYGAGFQLSSDIASVLLVPAGNADIRAKNYAHCRAKAGLA